MWDGERCLIDGLPLVRDGVCDCPDCRPDGPHRQCLNEQVPHHYHWPDKTKNSGWVPLTSESYGR